MRAATVVRATRWSQPSPLGPITVETSPLGVRRVELGVAEADATLAADGAAGDDLGRGRADAVADALEAYFAGDLAALDAVPVDLAAVTPFRRAVLDALRLVGPGEVTTYGALAAQVGRPGAARAVGGAVGSNPVPLVVPCHRVVAAAGAIGGYSAGLERKMWLLDHEGVPGDRARRAGGGQPSALTSTPRRRR